MRHRTPRAARTRATHHEDTAGDIALGNHRMRRLRPRAHATRRGPTPRLLPVTRISDGSRGPTGGAPPQNTTNCVKNREYQMANLLHLSVHPPPLRPVRFRIQGKDKGQWREANGQLQSAVLSGLTLHPPRSSQQKISISKQATRNSPLDTGSTTRQPSSLCRTPPKPPFSPTFSACFTLLMDCDVFLRLYCTRDHMDNGCPLMAAAYNGHFDVVRLLIASGAGVQACAADPWLLPRFVDAQGRWNVGMFCRLLCLPQTRCLKLRVALLC